MERLIIHWSAGTHTVSALDRQHYHYIIDGAGAVHRGDHPVSANAGPLVAGRYAAHTLTANTGSIGIALCCASEAQACSGRDTDFGGEPPTVVQIETLAKAVAVLTACLELEINVLTVTTHCEAALFDGYGPHSGDPQLRWDLWYLPDLPLDSALKPGGYVIRGKALWYLSEILRQRR